MSTSLSFRDYAAAVMQGDQDRGAEILASLLDVDVETARTATTFFARGLAGSPEFMMKAMGMRTVVSAGTEEALAALLGECFGLEEGAAAKAAKAVRAKFGSPT